MVKCGFEVKQDGVRKISWFNDLGKGHFSGMRAWVEE